MSEIVFKPDEEFDAFQPEDKSIDLVGYVESIEGLKTLRTTQGHVLKFVVHNGSKSRMRVLVWGSALAMHYEETIKLNSIVEITGGSLRSANTHFRQPNDKTSTLEFNVQAHSTLTIHGQYDITDQTVVDESYQPIQLDDVMICNGNIEIQCFIKNEFVQVQTPSTSFGQGVVVDGDDLASNDGDTDKDIKMILQRMKMTMSLIVILLQKKNNICCNSETKEAL